jgi:hypothetical protein
VRAGTEAAGGQEGFYPQGRRVKWPWVESALREDERWPSPEKKERIQVTLVGASKAGLGVHLGRVSRLSSLPVCRLHNSIKTALKPVSK